jgi:hypothetical protein
MIPSTTRKIQQLMSAFNAPTWVKAAAEQDYANATFQEFADPFRRRLPLVTPGDVWKSAALLFTDPSIVDKPDQAVARVKQAAKLFGIEKEIDALDAAVKKAAAAADDLTDDDYALVMPVDGTVRRRYPLRNRHEVKTAADYLLRYRDQMAWQPKNQMAARILEKAAEFGADIRDEAGELHKLAGRGCCDAEDAKRLLLKRAAAVPPRLADADKVRDTLTTVAGMIDSQADRAGQLGDETLLKLADIVTHVDIACGHNAHYGKDADRPEDTLFGTTPVKLAAAVDSMAFSPLTGRVYAKEDLARVKTAAIAETFGERFLADVSPDGVFIDPDKLTDKIATLSRREAELLDSLLLANDARPIATTRSGAVSLFIKR